MVPSEYERLHDGMAEAAIAGPVLASELGAFDAVDIEPIERREVIVRSRECASANGGGRARRAGPPRA